MNLENNPWQDAHYTSLADAARAGNQVAYAEQQRRAAVAAGDVSQQTPRERERVNRRGGSW